MVRYRWVFRALLALLLIPTALQSFTTIARTTAPADLCDKDLLQDYLMVRALQEGSDPYQSIPSLVRQYQKECSEVPYHEHPSPHTVPMAVATAGLFGGKTLAEAFERWHLVQVALLLVAIALLRRLPDTPLGILETVCLGVVAFGSLSTQSELYHGQANIFLLLLFSSGLLAQKRGDESLAGILFGLATGIKFFGALLLFQAVAQRRWRMVGGFLVGFVTCLTLWLLVGGQGSLLRYFTEVVPQMSAYYRNCSINQSVWSLPSWLFQGSERPCFPWREDGSTGTPLWIAPELFAITEYLLPVVLVALLFVFALRWPSRLRSTIAVIVLGTVASPIVWGHAIVQTLVVLPLLLQGAMAEGSARRHLMGASLWMFGAIILPLVAAFAVHAPDRVPSAVVMVSNTSLLWVLVGTFLALAPGAARQERCD